MTSTVNGHGGQLALEALRAFGVTELFTLSGGHVFPLYDAAHQAGLRIVDVRHEQSAVFAAEAVAKLQRRPGLAVLTAGPGITNGISGLTSAYFNAAPVVVIGGRAPAFRWGSGSLQELDHLPLVAPVTKRSVTVFDTDEIARAVREAATVALSAHRGPVFLDFPLEVIFGAGTGEVGEPEIPVEQPDPDEVVRAAALIAAARRPVIVAGSDVYSGDAIAALREAAEALRVPVFANGMGRGALPPEHPLAFAKARRVALSGADLVVVIGTPLDFRLGFGDFGDAQVVHIVDAPSQKATHVTPSAAPAGDLRTILGGLADFTGDREDHADWIDTLRAAEDKAKARDAEAMAAESDPIKPARVYGELRRVLARDAVTIGDGGDFVSYAGRYLEPSIPRPRLAPRPYGCLGTRMGHALGAPGTHPHPQVCVLLGDGAARVSVLDD